MTPCVSPSGVLVYMCLTKWVLRSGLPAPSHSPAYNQTERRLCFTVLDLVSRSKHLDSSPGGGKLANFCKILPPTALFFLPGLPLAIHLFKETSYPALGLLGTTSCFKKKISQSLKLK